MQEPPDAGTLICPLCHMPVDPSKPDAMLSAATKQWQHRDCWTRSLKRKAITPEDIDKRRK